MEGRHFAVIVSLLVWILGYCFSFLFFSHRFSNGIIAKLASEKFSPKKLNYVFLMIPVISPFIAGQAYRIGGIFEFDNGISWGCYIEDFALGAIFMLSLSVMVLFVVLVISIIKPNLLGFSARPNALKWYVSHHLYVFLLMLIIWYFIPILSGPLSGKEGSCW